MSAAADRKFLSEFAVLLYSARWFLLPASELASGGEIPTDLAEIANRCHIYLICRRPSCSFDPSSFSWGGERISGHIVHRVEGVPSRLPFSIPFTLVDEAVGVRVSPYPHREIETFDANGKTVRRVPADPVAVGIVDDRLRTLEVLYVGQAFGDGSRAAIDRLRSHSTLQKILAETSHILPDDQILLLAFEYVPYSVITMMDGTAAEAISDESDTERFISILDNPLTKHQQICLIEAALIRYFQPKYNEVYKTSFPATNQRLLDECYRLDFSALIVEIDTEDLRITLRAPQTPALKHHIAKFDLVDLKIRRSFFAFVKDGKALTIPGVIA